ncbi:MAG: NAD-binding oxidoreductase, partial [Rubrivivax sp.]
MRLFSYRNRPVHLGPYPLERLTRQRSLPDLDRVTPMGALSFDDANPESLNHALARYAAMFDLVRDGAVNPKPGDVPSDPAERARHLKAAGYYFDASMMACCALPPQAVLAEPLRNPDVAALGAELQLSHPKSFAAGLDMILADVLESARTVHGAVTADDPAHRHALVILIEYPREPRAGEPGCDWIGGTQAQRAAVLAAQTAVLLSTYLRMLGHCARAHSATCSEVDLAKLAVGCGLVDADGNNPYIGRRFGLAAVTTAFEVTADLPLAPRAAQRRWQSHGLAWWLGGSGRGQGFTRSAFNRAA